MRLKITAETIYWKGPAPFIFVPIPEAAGREIKALSRELTYGWGVIPVKCTSGKSVWTTSLFPKDGVYLIPVKKVVQLAESVEVGRTMEITIELG